MSFRTLSSVAVMFLFGSVANAAELPSAPVYAVAEISFAGPHQSAKDAPARFLLAVFRRMRQDLDTPRELEARIEDRPDRRDITPEVEGGPRSEWFSRNLLRRVRRRTESRCVHRQSCAA